MKAEDYITEMKSCNDQKTRWSNTKIWQYIKQIFCYNYSKLGESTENYIAN